MVECRIGTEAPARICSGCFGGCRFLLPPDGRSRRLFVGGRGLAVHFLVRHLQASFLSGAGCTETKVVSCGGPVLYSNARRLFKWRCTVAKTLTPVHLPVPLSVGQVPLEGHGTKFCETLTACCQTPAKMTVGLLGAGKRKGPQTPRAAHSRGGGSGCFGTINKPITRCTAQKSVEVTTERTRARAARGRAVLHYTRQPKCSSQRPSPASRSPFCALTRRLQSRVDALPPRDDGERRGDADRRGGGV